MDINEIANTIQPLGEARFTHEVVPSTIPVAEIRKQVIALQVQLYKIQEQIVSLVEGAPDETFNEQEWDYINNQYAANAKARVHLQ